jgi:hypothetical protein
MLGRQVFQGVGTSLLYWPLSIASRKDAMSENIYQWYPPIDDGQKLLEFPFRSFRLAYIYIWTNWQDIEETTLSSLQNIPAPYIFFRQE